MGNCIPRRNLEKGNTPYEIRICPGLFVKQGKGDPYSKYELVSYLGEGGFGKVYRVKDKLTGTNRAMKIIHVKSTSSDHEKKISKEILILSQFMKPIIIMILKLKLDYCIMKI